jgi:hypothetical protein
MRTVNEELLEQDTLSNQVLQYKQPINRLKIWDAISLQLTVHPPM